MFSFYSNLELYICVLYFVILLDKIAFLESQLIQAEKREDWLKGQVEKAQETIKLLEYKKPTPKGLFGRVISAIKSE